MEINEHTAPVFWFPVVQIPSHRGSSLIIYNKIQFCMLIVLHASRVTVEYIIESCALLVLYAQRSYYVFSSLMITLEFEVQ